jgi:hypothetical protein
MWLRASVIGALALAGCFAPHYDDGGVRCSLPAHACPDGYRCIDDRCVSSSDRLDLSVPAAAHPDMSAPPRDLALPSSDGAAPMNCPGVMRFVAGGTFTPANATAAVTVGSYCLAVDATTTLEYAGCTLCGNAIAGQFYNAGVTGREQHPINGITHDQALAYCVSRGWRLPNENEWEWAARGGAAGTLFAWGSTSPTATDSPQLLCWSGTATTRYRPSDWPAADTGSCAIGSYPAGNSPLGIHDLTGNMTTWTATAGDMPNTFVIRVSDWAGTHASYFLTSSRYQGVGNSYNSEVGVRCAANPTF